MTSWKRWLLLGDLGQQMDLHEHADRLHGLRRGLRSKIRTDAEQDERIEALEREVLVLGAGITALLDLLRDKQVCTAAEITAALERGTAAAEQAARERDAEAAAAKKAATLAAAAAKKASARRRRRT